MNNLSELFFYERKRIDLFLEKAGIIVQEEEKKLLFLKNLYGENIVNELRDIGISLREVEAGDEEYPEAGIVFWLTEEPECGAFKIIIDELGWEETIFTESHEGITFPYNIQYFLITLFEALESKPERSFYTTVVEAEAEIDFVTAMDEARETHDTLKKYFSTCYVKSNLAPDISYPKVATKLPIPITLDNAEKLIWQPDMNTFIGLRDAAMFAVLIGCGVRISELVSLHDEDLFATGCKGKTQFFLRVNEKGGKERVIPLPHGVQLLIAAYLGHSDIDDINRQTADGRHVLFVSTIDLNNKVDVYVGEARRMPPSLVHKRLVLHGRRAFIPSAQLSSMTRKDYHLLSWQMIKTW